MKFTLAHVNYIGKKMIINSHFLNSLLSVVFEYMN